MAGFQLSTEATARSDWFVERSRNVFLRHAMSCARQVMFFGRREMFYGRRDEALRCVDPFLCRRGDLFVRDASKNRTVEGVCRPRVSAWESRLNSRAHGMKLTFAGGDVCVEPDALVDGLLAYERQRAAFGVDVAKIDRLLAL